MTASSSAASRRFSPDMIARRVCALFVAPREYEGLEPVFEAARHAKVPVFLIDREAAGVAGEDYVSFLGSNFIGQGKRAAEWLVASTGGNAKVVELTGTAGSSVAADRAKGFRDGIAGHDGVEIIASQTAQFARAAAQTVMQNLVQALGRDITAIYAHNDEMALGAVQALRAAGITPGKDVTLVTYSIGVGVALEAAQELMGQGINAEVIDLRTLRPLDKATVLESLKRTNRMVVVEERWPTCSIRASPWSPRTR